MYRFNFANKTHRTNFDNTVVQTWDPKKMRWTISSDAATKAEARRVMAPAQNVAEIARMDHRDATRLGDSVARVAVAYRRPSWRTEAERPSRPSRPVDSPETKE